MEDTVKATEVKEERQRVATILAKELEEHKGENTVLIDLEGRSDWTDYFLITTVQSQGHLKGVVRALKGKLSELQVEVFHRHRKIAEDGWELIDCGFMVIHLMTKEMRDFYELERLWFEGNILIGENDAGNDA